MYLTLDIVYRILRESNNPRPKEISKEFLDESLYKMYYYDYPISKTEIMSILNKSRDVITFKIEDCRDNNGHEFHIIRYTRSIGKRIPEDNHEIVSSNDEYSVTNGTFIWRSGTFENHNICDIDEAKDIIEHVYDLNTIREVYIKRRLSPDTIKTLLLKITDRMKDILNGIELHLWCCCNILVLNLDFEDSVILGTNNDEITIEGGNSSINIEINNQTLRMVELIVDKL